MSTAFPTNPIDNPSPRSFASSANFNASSKSAVLTSQYFVSIRLSTRVSSTSTQIATP